MTPPDQTQQTQNNASGASQVATPPDKFRILLVDDDDVIRSSIVSYLSMFHPSSAQLEIESCADIPPAKELLTQKSFDLVITDINLPSADGFTLIHHIEDNYPKIKTALITAYKVEDYIKTAKKTGVFNIIPKTAPFNFQELATVVQNLLTPGSAFHLENYLKPGTPLTEYTISNSDQIMDAFFQLREFFTSANVRHIDDLSTAMIEAMTNAVYHVAKLPDGSLKYQKGQRIEALEESEYVKVSYGRDDEKIGVAICDQGGRITADEVMYWLERNISGSGLLDTHGRGVFLIHTLVDRLIINIMPNQCTEILILDYFSNEYSSNKPLYINQLSP